jgi:hypothetical protein
MEIPIEAPLEVKRAVARALTRRGALRRIEMKIKLAMRVAVEEIREDPSQPGALDRHRFEAASPHELRALQLIYAFLAERSLTYTLTAMEEEACIARASADGPALTDLVAPRKAQRRAAARAGRPASRRDARGSARRHRELDLSRSAEDEDDL